ncbi:MAG: preprotein translocase subunit SecG [Candidatus Colwellbacteria bacterium CG10_big_fil_rev_8_21_14_0_10_42_22]|uniref:Protein-export membrane protein SecG n=1 Tax=Candidatus Colwellbacteria bacterium CG10_big_fil_rev_8_21_14_0_10_42_22 TaxID=1974540 RepID=A0A2H0VGM1_9BACT|nr:MAG: preprotein translocase subunit SecG [Candidatus Colwellbacteria bacterium CG10_big_fil_rev_8_21_14_0_10_42_22]
MNTITVLQLIAGVVTIVLILLQQRSSGAGGLFGGGGSGGFYQRRRGIERTLFMATIGSVAIFTLLSIANLIPN